MPMITLRPRVRPGVLNISVTRLCDLSRFSFNNRIDTQLDLTLCSNPLGWGCGLGMMGSLWEGA